MAKFDLFNVDSWYMTKTIANMQNIVMGAMGNKIGEIKLLKTKLQRCIETPIAANSAAYDLALTLTDEETSLLNVQIHYPTDDIFQAIKACDDILMLWNKNKGHREMIKIKELVPLLKAIEPYMKECGGFFGRPGNLTKITITGNSIWDRMMRDKEMAVYWHKAYQEAIKKLEEYEPPKSEDYSDYDPDLNDE